MDDDRLLAELGSAVRDAGQVPAGFLAAGRAAFAMRNIDADLARLTEEPVAAVRGAEVRTYTFRNSELTIEVELADDAVLGQIVPPQAGTVEARDRTGPAVSAVVDDLGFFALRPVPSGMFRLYYSGASGVQVLTEWMTR